VKVSSAFFDLIKTFEGANLTNKVVDNLEKSVAELIDAPLNQNQFDALVSFASNMGLSVLKDSQLLFRINKLEDPCEVAREELHKWNKDGNRVFQGLSRRRSAELDLFCCKPPEYKWGWVTITSRCHTYLKKQPKSHSELSQDELAKVIISRTIKRCRVLERRDGHTYLELGFGLGDWWIVDRHWKGLRTEIEIMPYAKDKDLFYLRNFPYLYQGPNDAADWRNSQACCIAMCLKYIDVPVINSVNDYLNVVNKHGSVVSKYVHKAAMNDLGYNATFNSSADSTDLKNSIERGLPVAVSLVSKRHVSSPVGGTHFVVVTGYSDKGWLVQDPFGKLDLVNGGWDDRGADAGRNAIYDFENFERRFCVTGGATGWCWLNFREKD